MVIVSNQLNQLYTAVYRARLNPPSNHFYRLAPISSSDVALMLCDEMQSSGFFGMLLCAKNRSATPCAVFYLAGPNLTNQGPLNV